MNAAESGAVRWAMSLAVAVLLCPPYAHGWTLDLSTINPLSTTGGLGWD